MQKFSVTFKEQAKTIRVARGTDVLTAAIKAGIVMTSVCGGEGLCGKCKCVIEKGHARSEVSRFISPDERKKGVSLACQTIIEGDMEVLIPKESIEVRPSLSHESEEFTKGVILKREDKFAFSPLVRKIYVELPPPSADDNVSDLERIYREIETKVKGLHFSTNLASVKHLSQVVHESEYKVTAVLGYKDDVCEILTIEPGDTSASNFGFAFDIGTTTVVGQLINLNTKEILGTRIAFNKQAGYGSDIITRIVYASEPEGLETLNEAVLDNINEIIEDLLSACNVEMASVNALVCAGNMTMMHLLLKIDPANIRRAPYVPATTVFPTIHATEVGIETNPKGIVSFLPGVSSYVGGDIVSGILACGLAESEEITMLVDIGTNGEIVLGNKDWMIGAAASAGPAFEGSGLSCGMKAVKGAIDKVRIDEKSQAAVNTIGGEKPKGVCGSGYIDLLCQMLIRGIIDKSGKIRKGKEFVVVPKDRTAIEKDIVINEDDIENLKRSKGAIYSAIMELLNKVEKKVQDVKKIYIAGGFGNYLNIENAIFIGLLPDIDRDIYEFIGNSSLAGARMSLVSHEAFTKAKEFYKNITYVDLSSEPNYMDEYVASLFFPHTDIGRFPSVRL